MSSLAKSALAGAALVLLALGVERMTRPAKGPAGQVAISATSGGSGRMPVLAWLESLPESGPWAEPPRPDLSGHIQQALASGTPEGALHAYALIRACMDGGPQAQTMPVILRGAAVPSQDECSGLTETQKRDRLSYLERALQANVRGAAVAALREGPFGDWSALQTRPDDPLVRDWQRKVSAALIAQAEQGDTLSLSVAAADGAAMRYLPDIGPVRALAYMLALARLDPQWSHFEVLADLQKESMLTGDIEAAEREAERIVARGQTGPR
jgi:hypothetical protein